MTRSKIAKITNLSIETLRYYENFGLITPRRDPKNDYRVYADDDIIKLDFISRLKSFGFSLQDIKQFFDLVNKSKYDKSEFNMYLNKKIKDIDKQIENLQSMKNSLIKFRDRDDIESCNILSKLLS